MVSLPIVPDTQDPKPIVGFFNNSWSAYLAASGVYATYPNALSWFNPQSSTPGRGFWAFFETHLTPEGTIPNQTVSTKVHLYRGWNLVGNPFAGAVKWDLSAIKIYYGSSVNSLGSAASLGLVAGYAWGWQPDSTLAARGKYFLVYDSSVMTGIADQLEPWQAYWIRSSVDCDIEFPGLTQEQILDLKSSSILEGE
jgi:hypothetical protein